MSCPVPKISLPTLLKLHYITIEKKNRQFLLKKTSVLILYMSNTTAGVVNVGFSFRTSINQYISLKQCKQTLTLVTLCDRRQQRWQL